MTAGHSQAEAAERLGASGAEVRAAVDRAKRASRRLDPAVADF
jgi:DNA-directed RNA polymerase specialized sigma24 family protein